MSVKRKIEKKTLRLTSDGVLVSRTLLSAFAAQKIDSVTQVRLYLEIAAMQAEKKEPTPSSVAARLEIPLSTASRLIWDLMQKGLAGYQPHKGDRRKKVLSVIQWS